MGNRATIESRPREQRARMCVSLARKPRAGDRGGQRGRAAHARTDASYALGRLFGHYAQLRGRTCRLPIGKDESDYYLTNGHYVVDMAKGTIEQGGVALAEGLEFGQF
jgi:hypothetical protein